MRYTYYYKKYEHSKLATFISGLQASFWGVISIAFLPAMPLFIIGINSEDPPLLIASGIITIALTIFIFCINTDKIEERAYKQKLLQDPHLKVSYIKKFLSAHYIKAAYSLLSNVEDEIKANFDLHLENFELQIHKYINEYISGHGLSFVDDIMQRNRIPPLFNKEVGNKVLANIIYYTFEDDCELFKIWSHEIIINKLLKFIESDHFNNIQNIMEVRDLISDILEGF